VVTAETTLLDRFNEQGYAIIQGLLDIEKDIQPVFDEYAPVLDELLDRLYRDGVVKSTYSGLPLLRRMTGLIAETGAAY
jgi:hypothetical protein